MAATPGDFPDPNGAPLSASHWERREIARASASDKDMALDSFAATRTGLPECAFFIFFSIKAGHASRLRNPARRVNGGLGRPPHQPPTIPSPPLFEHCIILTPP